MIKRVVPFDMLAPFLREQMDDGAMITAIRNAWIVTQDASRRIIRGDVVIDGERIVSVGPAYNGTADREIDATGDIIMPGIGVLTGGADFKDLKYMIQEAGIDAAGNVRNERGCRRSPFPRFP